jgi:hypothetical protein
VLLRLSQLFKQRHVFRVHLGNGHLKTFVLNGITTIARV